MGGMKAKAPAVNTSYPCSVMSDISFWWFTEVGLILLVSLKTKHLSTEYLV